MVERAACMHVVADRLGIDKILIPQTAGIFSARGVSYARKEKLF